MANNFGLAQANEECCEANVDTAKSAATLRIHPEMKRNAGWLHLALGVGLMSKNRISMEAGFVEGKVQG